MGEWRLLRYGQEMRPVWDAFVRESRNATFLFERAYMDYHSDRFADCSWIALKGDKPVALLPANLTEDRVLQSHGGLSYGGWLLPKAHIDGADLLGIFSSACDEWRKSGIKMLDYKPMPYIYCLKPSEEDIYALFRLGARLTECNLSAAIDLRSPGRFNKLQRRHLSKARALNAEVGEWEDIPRFMEVLAACLSERHGVQPVHTAEEMKLLAARFPQNIKFYAACLGGVPHAAVCIYDTGLVAHAQYIATTPEGRELNLLSLLFDYLITECYAARRYFDFGISNEHHGTYLNEGLLRQKYSYGATGVVYSRYSLSL